MARIPALKPLVKLLPPILAMPENKASWSRRCDKVIGWCKWYKTSRWQDLRWKVLARDGFTCRFCKKTEIDTSQLVADHIIPHKGNEGLFWDKTNLQCLCKACHDGTKKKQENKGFFFNVTHPEHLLPSLIPLVIICGAPASGKSFYVENNRGINDFVIDMDRIAESIIKYSGHDWDRQLYGMQVISLRNEMLSGLSNISITDKYDRAWFIVSEPDADKRLWWQQKLQPERIVVIETDESQCLLNMEKDGDRDREQTSIAINSWWNRYRPRPGAEERYIFNS